MSMVGLLDCKGHVMNRVDSIIAMSGGNRLYKLIDASLFLHLMPCDGFTSISPSLLAYLELCSSHLASLFSGSSLGVSGVSGNHSKLALKVRLELT